MKRQTVVFFIIHPYRNFDSKKFRTNDEVNQDCLIIIMIALQLYADYRRVYTRLSTGWTRNIPHLCIPAVKNDFYMRSPTKYHGNTCMYEKEMQNRNHKLIIISILKVKLHTILGDIYSGIIVCLSYVIENLSNAPRDIVEPFWCSLPYFISFSI